MAKEQTRILVVDDDVHIVQFMKNALKDVYIVDTALCLADALDLFDEYSYSVVVTDLNLAQESGMTLARYVREKDPYVEVIIVTGHASVESELEAIDIGVSTYLNKPIMVPTLLMKVNRAVMSYRFKIRSKIESHEEALVPEKLKLHLAEILEQYQFVTKLNQTRDLALTAHVLLKELSRLYCADLAVLGINALGFKEIYSFSPSGLVGTEEGVRKTLIENWNNELAISGIDKEQIASGLLPVEIIATSVKMIDSAVSSLNKPFILQLDSYGEQFGFIALFRNSGAVAPVENHEFFYAMAPLFAPPVYRGITAKKMHEQAQTDGLTGIANRRALQEALARDIQRAVRYDRPLSVIIMDIDDFKKVNDTYGHLMGDEVLKDLTVAVKTVIRGSDFFGRYGGEEFVVILPDTERVGANHLAERIREVIEKRVCVSAGVSVDYRASIGVAVFTPENIIISDGVDWGILESNLIGRADDALYMAKGKGKNCVVMAD